MTPRRSGVDMRRFQWQLSPLEAKLEWERDAARAGLARVLDALRQAQRQARQLEALHAQQGAEAATVARRVLDPHAHRHLLTQLAALQQQVMRAGARGRQLESALALARDDCASAQHKLESLLAARARAMRAYVAEAALRQDRQADDAWLTHNQSARAARGVAP